MDFVLQILAKEQKDLEKLLKANDLMRVNMSFASVTMANIAQLKKAIKIIKNKSIKLS